MKNVVLVAKPASVVTTMHHAKNISNAEFVAKPASTATTTTRSRARDHPIGRGKSAGPPYLKKIKTNSLSEEEEGNVLSRYFRTPIDSPMESKTSSSEEEGEDECIYTNLFKDDGCHNMGKHLVECRD